MIKCNRCLSESRGCGQSGHSFQWNCRVGQAHCIGVPQVVSLSRVWETEFTIPEIELQVLRTVFPARVRRFYSVRRVNDCNHPTLCRRSQALVIFSAALSRRTRDTSIAFMLKVACMGCSCSSEKRRIFTGEIAIQRQGSDELNKPIVWVFPDLVICLGCGVAEFEVPTDQLSSLQQGASKPH